MEDNQRYKEKTLAPGTVKQHLSLLRQMFDHAIDWDYLRKNPAKKVPNPKVPKREKDFLAPDEVRALLEHTSERWYAFILVAVTTGLRVGELLAMKWSNVDWDQSKYFVRENLQRKTETHPKGFSAPKSDDSVAPVDLSPRACEALASSSRMDWNRPRISSRIQSSTVSHVGMDFNGALCVCSFTAILLPNRASHPVLCESTISREV